MNDGVIVTTEGEHGEFLVAPERAKSQLREMQAVVRDVMVEGEHYGMIPGTQKLTLLKPGAELLNSMYGLYLDSVEILEKTEQWDIQVDESSFPLFRYITRCTLKDRNGVTISTGVGECNSYESKYRWRNANRKCPRCGREAIIKGREEFGGGWVCFRNKGGCGAKFRDGDETIESQTTGRVPNESIYDQVNTIIKMAKKRSYIDATLSATRTSGIFTQDLEDFATLSSVHAPAATPAPETSAPDPPASSTQEPGEFVMPMGINKGKKLSEIDPETLRKAAAWCRQHQKFLDVARKIDQYVGDDAHGNQNTGKGSRF